MKRFLTALGMLLPLQAMAGGEWTTTDSLLLGGALLTLRADWSQTRAIASAPARSGIQESNPVMGEHPSGGTVNRYFLVTAAGTAGLAYVLPASYRRAFLGSMIVVETAVVLHNNQLGLQMRF